MPNKYSREWWQERLPFIEAFVQKKALEINLAPDLNWQPLSDEPTFTQDISCYRVKPESRFRPWEPKDVPLGCWIRQASSPKPVGVIVSALSIKFSDTALIRFTTLGEMISKFKTVMADTLLSDFEHSTDSGTTWHPCGILEDSTQTNRK